ncbi:MAG: hypothetical protein Q7S43_00775 [bacterium]|nr:hypothetical protein [bacterium]
MAKMTFAVSEKEFAEKVKQLSSCLPTKTKDPIDGIVNFFNSFMIDMENESMLGYYDHELRVGYQSIPLDVLGLNLNCDVDQIFRKLIKEALAS